MTQKEIRKKIRQCNTSEELRCLLISLTRKYNICLKSKAGIITLADIFIRDNYGITCHFPFMWARRFKNFKHFSYNIIIEQREGYREEGTGIHLLA